MIIQYFFVFKIKAPIIELTQRNRMERMGKLESYIEAPKGLRVKNFLWDLSSAYSCPVVILDHDTGWFKETVRFRFTGEESGLLAVQKELKKAIEKYQKESFTSDTYKVKNAQVYQYEGGSMLTMIVSASKFSGMKHLPELLADHLDLPISINEDKKGFLKGKLITATTQGQT
jgi:hypothetical protein